MGVWPQYCGWWVGWETPIIMTINKHGPGGLSQQTVEKDLIRPVPCHQPPCPLHHFPLLHSSLVHLCLAWSLQQQNPPQRKPSSPLTPNSSQSLRLTQGGGDSVASTRI